MPVTIFRVSPLIIYYGWDSLWLIRVMILLGKAKRNQIYSFNTNNTFNNKCLNFGCPVHEISFTFTQNSITAFAFFWYSHSPSISLCECICSLHNCTTDNVLGAAKNTRITLRQVSFLRFSSGHWSWLFLSVVLWNWIKAAVQPPLLFLGVLICPRATRRQFK